MLQNELLNNYLKEKGMTEKGFELLTNPIPEHDPMLFSDMEAVVRFLLAYAKDNTVIICGDYDADGVTSSTILYLMAKTLGFNVEYHIPLRHNGYGLSVKTVEEFAETHDASKTLLLTCDNGIAAFDAVSKAKELGFIVIVTDHHEIQDRLPEADCIIHPQLGYPFAAISGATVAYKLAQAVIKATPEIEWGDLPDYFLQLATISIISDVMPVGSFDEKELALNENRGILIKGLKSLNERPNHHLKKFFEMIGITIGQIDETTIGFSIAPVINAVGRLFDAVVGLKAFIADNEDDLIVNLSYMVYCNDKRKALTKEAVAKIIPTVNPSDSFIIVESDVHEGLVGIVAGNIVSQFEKPCVVFTQCEINGEKAWKGSARSNGIPLMDVLSKVDSSLMINFGGHAGAAGISVADKNMAAFKTALLEATATVDYKEEEKIRVEISSASELNDELAEGIKILKPLGNGFDLPFRHEFIAMNYDFFYASRHVKISNFIGKHQNEVWLYGELDKFLSNNYITGYSLTNTNRQKKIDEGLTPEMADGCKWERYAASFTDAARFALEGKLDYSFFMGTQKLTLSVDSYEKSK